MLLLHTLSMNYKDEKSRSSDEKPKPAEEMKITIGEGQKREQYDPDNRNNPRVLYGLLKFALRQRHEKPK